MIPLRCARRVFAKSVLVRSAFIVLQTCCLLAISANALDLSLPKQQSPARQTVVEPTPRVARPSIWSGRFVNQTIRLKGQQMNFCLSNSLRCGLSSAAHLSRRYSGLVSKGISPLRSRGGAFSFRHYPTCRGDTVRAFAAARGSEIAACVCA